MAQCYIHPYLIALVGERLGEDKLADIIDAIFDGLVAADGGSRGTGKIRAA